MLKINNILLYKTPDEIEKSFDKFGQIVSNTKELNNVILTYIGVKEPVYNISLEDQKERNWLHKKIDSAISELEKEKYTRKAIIYNLFPSKLDHNCLNNLHLYYRNNTLNMNVYVRSMNYDINFQHDLYTFETILNKACQRLVLNKGRVTLFIMSLHKFINS